MLPSRLLALEVVADRDQSLLRVEADQVAHQVVAGVGVRHRQRGEDVATHALQVARDPLADILAQHLERRAAVEAHGDVAVRLAERVHRAEW